MQQETKGDKARQSGMQAVNPVYIHRNHLIEAAIGAAEERGDYSVFHELHAVLRNPYAEQTGKEGYRMPPKPEELVYRMFYRT